MQYLEYKLDMGPGGMHTPYWIDDGGYWHNPANNTMVGATRDNTEFKIPDTVTKLTAAELETRVVAIHGVTPLQTQTLGTVTNETEDMTEAEVRAAVQRWVTSHS